MQVTPGLAKTTNTQFRLTSQKNAKRQHLLTKQRKQKIQKTPKYLTFQQPRGVRL